ncbi:MAG: hypothetical protein M1457_12660 [bacterium]|nr:hypothetical protein [bacterium]
MPFRQHARQASTPAAAPACDVPLSDPPAQPDRPGLADAATGFPPAWHTAAALFVFFMCLYCLTASKLRFGYEGQTIDQAEALLRGRLVARPGGGIEPFTQAGVLDVAVYLPFAALKLALERAGALPGLRQLAYAFALPFYTTLLCLAFFALARELYRRAGTALALTLIAGVATTIWPYSKFGMETQQTLWTLIAVWMLMRYRRRGGGGAAAFFGAALAALFLTKITGPLHAATLGLAAIWLAWRERQWQRPGFRRHTLLAAGLCLAGAIVFLTTNRWRYGGWLWGGRYGLAAETLPYPLVDGIWAVVASPGKSLFMFSPPLLVGLWFWAPFLRRFPPMRIVFVLMLALALLHLHNRPWADETWGPRRLHYLAALLMLPLGIWWEWHVQSRLWVRALVWPVIVFGVWVQLVAVLFDYTALARTAGGNAVFSQENTVWDPQMNPLRFNLLLIRSAMHRRHTGQPESFVYRQHYLPWTTPARPPAPVALPFKGDGFDFWFIQQRADWPGRPYWFVSLSSWLAPAFALGGLLSLAWLIRLARRLRGEPTDRRPPGAGETTRRLETA